MDPRSGSAFGVLRTGTIRKVNPNGTIVVALDNVGAGQPRIEFTAPFPAAWVDPKGGFLGGRPREGTSVIVSQGQSGDWYVQNYKSEVTPSFLTQGGLTAFVSDGHRWLLNPDTGFTVGKDSTFQALDSNLKIANVSYNSQYLFSDAYRSINSVIKRDLSETTNKNTLSSCLNSNSYDKNLYRVGFDPTVAVGLLNNNSNIRNPAYAESRTQYYEFSPEYLVTSYAREQQLYTDPSQTPKINENSRRNNRTDAFSLSQEFPNLWAEVITGTGADLFGNILDINRSVIPLGKVDSLTLAGNDRPDAYARMLTESRKAIGFHFELNAKKDLGDHLNPPNPNDTSNYARGLSRFSFDVDKEGQFKFNVPASSETGNLPLLTRAENYSVLKSYQDGTDPNAFLKPDNYQDIYLSSFAGYAPIKISGGSTDLDGYAAPLDRITGLPIKYGTAFHDISKTILNFQESAPYLQATPPYPLLPWDPNARLNRLWKPLKSVVVDTITIAGEDANAGGRSGTISMDGSLTGSFGANTSDRQSLILDTAGGVVTNFGRDKNGISWASSNDGDIFITIGGPGIPNSFDTRFQDQNDTYRNGTLDIRVDCNGQLSIIRVGPEGITLATPGTMTFSAAQSIIFKTLGNFEVEAENIVMYAESSKRVINRFPIETTIG